MRRVLALLGMAAVVIIACFFLREMEYQETIWAMDTYVTVTAKGYGAQAAVSAAMERVREIEGQLSAHVEGSDVWKINTGSEKWGSRDTIRVINRGIYFSKLTDGVFDVTIMPLIKLWQQEEIPNDQEILAAQRLVDYTVLQENTALPADMAIDLGGIAKGYVADEIAVVLKRNGISSAVINCGGDCLMMGSGAATVGIQAPFAQREQYMGTVEAADKAVVTSGIYERGAHIIDPRTGRPVGGEILSATVICDVAMDADALSTMLLILGEEGFPILEKYGAEGIIINKDNHVKTTKGAGLTITDGNYIMDSSEN